MTTGTRGSRSQRVAALRANHGQGEVTAERLNRLPRWAAVYIGELEAALLRAQDRAPIAPVAGPRPDRPDGGE
jgi:hypothetical protein